MQFVDIVRTIFRTVLHTDDNKLSVTEFVLELFILAAVKVLGPLEFRDLVAELLPDVVEGLFLSPDLAHNIVHVDVGLLVIRQEG